MQYSNEMIGNRVKEYRSIGDNRQPPPSPRKLQTEFDVEGASRVFVTIRGYGFAPSMQVPGRGWRGGYLKDVCCYAPLDFFFFFFFFPPADAEKQILSSPHLHVFSYMPCVN